MTHRSTLTLALLATALVPCAAAQFPSPVVLPYNAGLECVALFGSSGGAQLGLLQTPIGDFNGDGRADFAVAAHNWVIPGGNSSNNRGAVHVLFGSSAWGAMTSLDLRTLNGTQGFTVYGTNDGDQLGARIAAAGDVNGDGFDDLAMYARGFDIGGASNRGCVYVLFGGPQVGASGAVQASTIGGSSGLRAYPPTANFGSTEISGLGDLDGDGYGELAIAVPRAGQPEPMQLLGASESDSVAGGDIDGDGDGDFVVGQLALSRALVFTNANGQFTSQVLPLGCGPKRIELADMDGDGDLDMVVEAYASGGLARVAILPRLSGTTFGAPRNFDLPDHESFARLGDIDVDGDLDVLVANFTGSSGSGVQELVHILRNDGNGFLSQIGSVVFPDLPRSMSCGDIDGDGDADFALTGHLSSAIHAFENLGNGSFAPPVVSPPGGQVFDLLLADVDGDGDLDALRGSNTYLHLQRNQGGFSFQPEVVLGASDSTERVLADDVDGDGDLDVLTCGRDVSNLLRCFENRGDGTFETPRSYPQPIDYAYDLALTDIDGDGDLDPVIVGKVYLQPDYRAITVHSFGDGNFGGQEDGCVVVMRGSATIGAQGPHDLTQAPSGNWFVMLGRNGRERLGTGVHSLGDIDGDGLADMAVTTAGSYFAGPGGVAHFVVRGAPGIGSTGFIDGRALTGPDGFIVYTSQSVNRLAGSALSSGDFDGDGRLDLIVKSKLSAASGSGAESALVLFGSPTLGSTGLELVDQPDGTRLLLIQSPSPASSLTDFPPAIGDFNGDGRADVVLGCPLYSGALSSCGAALGTYGAARPFVAAELKIGNLDGKQSFGMLGANAGDFAATSLSRAGDVDGDGIEDLLISDDRFNGSSGRAFLILGQRYGVPLNYCTAQTNSAGCVPSISWSGALPSMSDPDAFHVRADGVLNQKSGLLFYGRFGRIAQPLNGGTLCARQPVIRTDTLSSGGSASGMDCSGSFDLDWSAWQASGADPSLVAGVTVDCQFWSRDPQAPSFTNLTSALEFTIAP